MRYDSEPPRAALMLAFLSMQLAGAWSGPRSFTIDYDNNCFLKDGQPFRYISGSMHYFRVLETSWEDRLMKMRKAGLNAVQTYVAWNLHEPMPGSYDFSGNKDLAKFLHLAQKHDLLVVLRPGPYICAEWEYGGFPAWLLKNQTMVIRSSKGAEYMSYVDRWMSALLGVVRPLLYVNGGPVISVQVENEYGSFGCDHEYMEQLRAMFLKYLTDDVILFTTDGAGDGYLKCGAVQDLYATVDFGAGGDVMQSFAYQRKYQSKGPLVNSEYYTGWLDHWGQPHAHTSADLVSQWLDKILAANASVNMYMFEGGTNFGFMNGANQDSNSFDPQPTSYDYDAPLTEAGDPTEKYFKIQQVIAKYADIPPGPQPVPSGKAAYGKVLPAELIDFHHVIDDVLYPGGAPYKSARPLSFEEIDFDYGYVLYRTELPKASSSQLLTIAKLHDRATVLVDKVFQGVLDRNRNSSIVIAAGTVLEILVENQGRVNYGGYMKDTAKGILSDVIWGTVVLQSWQMFPLGTPQIGRVSALARQKSLPSNTACSRGGGNLSVPIFAHFSFPVDVVHDTFLKLDNWNKGVALVNGFNLGRFWTPVGPQKTLYVPAVTLDSADLNSLLLFETDRVPCGVACYVEFVDQPILG